MEERDIADIRCKGKEDEITSLSGQVSEAAVWNKYVGRGGKMESAIGTRDKRLNPNSHQH